MKITYYLRDDGGCGYYRLLLPMGRIEQAGHKVEKIQAGMSADSIYDKLDSDIIVLPRPCDLQSLNTIKVLKEHGKKVVVDYDDDMFNVSPFSTHYKDFGTDDVKVKIGDEWMEIWRDGKNIDLKANRKTLDIIRQCVSAADMVTVTQPVLAEAYRGLNANVVSLPNCIDLKVWKKLPFQRRDDVRLYWSGGSSHYQDWLILQDVLPVVFDKYPQVKLVIMGVVFSGSIKKLDRKRIEVHEWVHTLAYPYKTATLDIDVSLIPLEENVFNSGKSNIKWVEQAALSIPSVCSAVTPYIEHNNGVNGVFVQNTVDEWVDGISCMIEDSILRARLGGEARDTVERHNDIDLQYMQWLDAYGTLL